MENGLSESIRCARSDHTDHLKYTQIIFVKALS